MRWIEITIETSAMAEDAVASSLIEAGCGGVAITGPSFFINKKNRPQADLYPETNRELIDRIWVSGYLPLDDSFERRLEDVKSRVESLKELDLDIGPAEITIKPVDEEDWATAWKAFFKPLKIGKIVIRPTWEDYAPEVGEVVLKLDPGMAFGTGTHPTTQLCLLALQKYVHGSELVLDLGCGSGILSIAAAKLGAAHVAAVDIDPVAVDAAVKNVNDEGLQNVIDVKLGDSPGDSQFDLVIANIIANTIISLSNRIKDALKPDGLLISSGIISDREQDVRSALESEGLETIEAMYEGEWVAFVSRRKDG